VTVSELSAPSERRPQAVVAALAGRPNSGKTSLLMHLTHTAQRPVNFPGSSVERVEASVRVGDRLLRAVDLPGIASLTPASPDEDIALRFLRGAQPPRPEVICAVVDASKLSVELALVRQLGELGLPIVLALNKTDVARATGATIDARALERALGLPVIETDARAGAGMEALRAALLEAAARPPAPPWRGDPDAVARSVCSIDGARRPGLTSRLDAIFLHRRLGLPILALVMLGAFELVYAGAVPFMDAIEVAQAWLGEIVAGALAPGALRSFLIDGLINGAGSVLVFLPQIALLIALISVLEGSGYMARAAFLLDRALSRVGLNGRSFLPLTTSFACAIPGILATRMIADERDRLATIAVAPLMSCSARLPVYVVLIGAFFPVAWAGLVLFALYLLGIAIAVACAALLRRTVLAGGHSLLVMELPVYQRPALRVVANQVWSAAREFVVLAGTFILATAVVIWLLSYYPRPAALRAPFEQQRAEVAALPHEAEREAILARLEREETRAFFEQSWLARIGKTIQPVFAPAGFDWRVTVGILAAFPARELVLPTLGILYGAGDVDAGDHDVASLHAAAPPPDGLRARLRTATGADGGPSLNPLRALALMVFFALCSQCAGTLGAIRRETRSWRWPLFTFAYMTTLAWIAAVAVNRIGSLFTGGAA
jgi:ferrous iron transport protein B